VEQVAPLSERMYSLAEFSISFDLYEPPKLKLKEGDDDLLLDPEDELKVFAEMQKSSASASTNGEAKAPSSCVISLAQAADMRQLDQSGRGFGKSAPMRMAVAKVYGDQEDLGGVQM